jgi:type I restriction enzyme, S subunit
VSTRPHSYLDVEDSGSKWLGCIPAHWDVRKLKHIASVRASNVDKKTVPDEAQVKLCNYVDVYYNDQITGTLDFMVATATEEQIRKFRLAPGDVCVTKDSEEWNDIAVPALVTENVPDLVCGYHLAMIRPLPDRILGRYLARCFAARGINDQFRVEANGITRFGLGTDSLKSGLFPVPPPDEQVAIADFLDRQTGKIDALIAKKERLIELLQEKRVAFIDRALTEGLTPNRKSKPTENTRIQSIPWEWEMHKLKYLLRKIEQGWSPQCENRTAQEGEWGVLKVGCMNSGTYDERENKALPLDVPPLRNYEVHVGDVLMSRSNTVELVGSVGVVHQTQSQILLCDKLFRLIFDERTVLPTYVVYLLRSSLARHQIEAEATGASPSMKNISHGIVANLLLPFPPRTEQQQILDRITTESVRIDALISKIREVIDRLQEYRTALVSAAVTGRIDVRQVQAQTADGTGKPIKIKSKATSA